MRGHEAVVSSPRCLASWRRALGCPAGKKWRRWLNERWGIVLQVPVDHRKIPGPRGGNRIHAD